MNEPSTFLSLSSFTHFTKLSQAIQVNSNNKSSFSTPIKSINSKSKVSKEERTRGCEKWVIYCLEPDQFNSVYASGLPMPIPAFVLVKIPVVLLVFSWKSQKQASQTSSSVPETLKFTKSVMQLVTSKSCSTVMFLLSFWLVSNFLLLCLFLLACTELSSSFSYLALSACFAYYTTNQTFFL